MKINLDPRTVAWMQRQIMVLLNETRTHINSPDDEFVLSTTAIVSDLLDCLELNRRSAVPGDRG